jgi:aldehyde dehydrogenase (NAD+)
MLVCRNFIEGRWVESKSPQRRTIVNPADITQKLAELPLSTREETRGAIEAAARAFPGWREVPGPKRGKLLLKAMRLMEERRDDLARTIVLEEGKIWKEAQAEVQRAIDALEHSAGEARRIRGTTLPSGFPGTWGMTIKQPVGVAGVITPWNFPLAIAVWKMGPALAAGCTVVLKPSPFVPISAERLFQVLEQCEFPPGVANLVQGDREVGEELIDHPAVRAIAFTGSTGVGREIYRRAAERGKKVQVQMGAKNAFVVLKEADLDAAAQGILQSSFGSSGQRCMATSRVIVENAVADDLMERLASGVRKLKVGSGLDPEVTVGPSIHQDQQKRVLQYVALGKEEGARLVAGGGRLEGQGLDKGFFVEPAIFDGVTTKMRIFQEEIFGPVLSVSRVKDLDEALTVANATPYGMAATVYTRDLHDALTFAERCEVGLLNVNVPMLPPQTQFPFGGIKDSGAGGRDQGEAGVEFFTETKVVTIRYRPHDEESHERTRGTHRRVPESI